MYSDVLWKYEPNSSQWTWVSGDTASTKVVYGTQGVSAPANTPGISVNSVEWTDATGNFWLYGNVLWRYDPLANLWTWIHGDTLNRTTSYGLKGVPGNSNTPGTRSGMQGWSDSSGKFWLFGGSGTVSTPYSYRYGASIYSGDLNDLWNYNPHTNEWTWMGGDTTLYSFGNTGTLGVAAPGNMPKARSRAVTWKDHSGNFWMFGGAKYTSFSQPNVTPYNDLWKYDPLTGQWTCLRNYSPYQSRDTFDVTGIESPNTSPAVRRLAAGWTDAIGNLWLFGGESIDVPQSLFTLQLNDLLKYNPATNRWSLEQKTNDGRQVGIYGTQGVSSTATMPGGRANAASATDSLGNLWLFGGQGLSSRGISYNALSDLWKRDSANRWAWMSGLNIPINYGNTWNPNIPAEKTDAIAWSGVGNKFWLFGGGGSASSPSSNNELWNFDFISREWTKRNGDIAGFYGIMGQPATANQPKSRSNAVNWKDKQGRLWLFGGIGYFGSEYNDVWNFDPVSNLWTWAGGDSTTGAPGIYGRLGIPNAANMPRARQGAVSWTDESDNVWIFGGYNGNNKSYLNDLWKYNTSTNIWTWISGDSTVNQKGVYGIKGLPDAANKPGARFDAVSWMDATGRLWLLGGVPGGILFGYTYPEYNLNDLWEYDPTNNLWTWVSGDSTVNAGGIYGRMGISGSTNTPGARSGAMGWKDKSGDFWLLGGAGYGSKGAGFLNDVWKFSPASLLLPVQFLDFSALRQKNEVFLQWSPAKERQAAYYAIQRSGDGIRFDSIGMITAGSAVRSTYDYNFVDNHPFSEVSYYRLKQADINGRYNFSTVRKVGAVRHPDFSVAIVQNPVTNVLGLSIQSIQSANLQLEVRDVYGSLLVSQKKSIGMGNSVYNISVRNLAAGTYLLVVSSGNTSVVKKFIKQ